MELGQPGMGQAQKMTLPQRPQLHHMDVLYAAHFAEMMGANLRSMGFHWAPVAKLSTEAIVAWVLSLSLSFPKTLKHDWH